MLKPRPAVIDPEALPLLAKRQQKVSVLATYAEQVAAAKKSWGAAKKSEPPFPAVKGALDTMCWGHRRCMYCEDSVADEIEHFAPKDRYPDRVFVWTNYLYACGPCNGPKGNAFAVFAAGDEVVELVGDEPPEGDVVLLDPRHDDPLDFLVLDLVDTFYFSPHPFLAGRAARRAEYTIEVLRLNERAYLVEARITAHSMLMSALGQAAHAATSGEPLAHPQRAIEKASHRSVWEEMKRQRASFPVIQGMFAAVPVALSW